MALKIRLRQQGRRNQIVYRLVLSDSRSPRDGKYIEVLGWYHPFRTEKEDILKVEAERISYWLGQGAILSEKAEALVKMGAPSVFEAYHSKVLQARAKACAKRKETKKRSKAAA